MLSDTVTRICRAGLIVVFNAAIVIQSVLCMIMLSTVSCPALTCCRINYASHRLQNSPYFCVFKYARAVKQKVWNEAENREQDWGETQKYVFFSSRLCPTPYPFLYWCWEKKNRLFCSLQVSEGEWEGECTRSSVLLSLRLYLSYSLGHSLYSYLAIYRLLSFAQKTLTESD